MILCTKNNRPLRIVEERGVSKTMSLNRPLLRTSKSTATLIRDNMTVTLNDVVLTKTEGTALTVQSKDADSIVTEGGISIAGAAVFQQMAMFNANISLSNPDFVLLLGPPNTDGTWRLRISGGYLIFEKFDAMLEDYVSRFHLY